MTTTDVVGTILDRLATFLRYGEQREEEVQSWLEKLEEAAGPDDLPRLFALLDDDDASGVLWDVLYIAEGLDDAYLRVLVEQLPALWARAPQWAITAVLRVLNTAGEEEDCVPRFVDLARGYPPAHAALRELAGQLEEEDEELVQEEQRQAVRMLIATLPE